MKGWTGKTSIPSQMIAHVAGIGEFAIKSGGPPAVTRLSGARKVVDKFDWEKASLRVVYEALKPSAIRSRSVNASISSGSVPGSVSGESTPAKQQQGSGAAIAGTTELDMIECEIRCDIDAWAASLDIVVDPPPQGISCLRRHKLSPEGGGLWLTLTHDPVYPSANSTFLNRRKKSTKVSIGSISELQSRHVGDDESEEEGKFRVIVRRAPGKEKGLVMVNGTKVTVDVEEMSESEVKNATKQKRVKPARVPLDQPPVVNVVRKRRAEWNDEGSSESQTPPGNSEAGANVPVRSTSTSRERTLREWATAPKQAGALTRWWSYAADVAASTVVPISIAAAPSTRSESMPSKQKWPMQYALEALEWTMEEYTEDRLGSSLVSSAISRNSSVDGAANVGTSSVTPSSSVSTTSDGWAFVGEKAGLGVYRKLISEVSPIVPIHRGTKIIEGVSAEELASAILDDSCRKEWDDRFDASRVFESFGWGCETGFTVLKGGFPFRDRGFYLARVVARPAPGGLAGMFGRLGRSRSIGRESTRDPGSLLKRSSTLGHPATYGRRLSGAQSNAIFIVSASYSGESDSVSRFSPSKYNEYVLPIGRAFVDVWVLETLDPYNTREIDVAIPSTRCTRVVAVDLRGSAPAAVNSMVNVAMVRVLSSLADWVGKRLKAKVEAGSTAATTKEGPAGLGIVAPFMRMPGGNIMLREARGGMEGLNRRGVAWSARVSDGKRALVKERFKIHERAYRCMMLVSVGSVLGVESEVKEKEEGSGRAASRAKSPRSPSPTRVDEAQSTGESAGHSRDISSGSHNNVEGTMVIPSSPPATARPRAVSSPYSKHRGFRQPADLLVAELVIDSKMYPDGYDILICSRKRSEEKIITSSCSRADATCISLRDGVVKTTATKAKGAMETTGTTSLLDGVANASTSSTTVDAPEDQALPLGYAVHTMASSPLYSSGLAAESPTRHLVRVTLPTAQYQLQTVEDPLTGETRSPPPKPTWLTEMEEGGSAVVEIEVRPRRDKVLSKKKGMVVRVNGDDVLVESEKESLTSLGREELMDDRLAKLPVLVM